MSGKVGPDIIEDGLVLYLDAGNKKSYPGSDVVWSDMSTIGVQSQVRLNQTNPVRWNAVCFSVFDEVTPTSVHYINANNSSPCSGYCYMGFRLQGKKVITWATYQISLKLEVISGTTSLRMGSSGGGYQEGPPLNYTTGVYNINKIFHISNYYSHETSDLEFCVVGLPGTNEARITDLYITERTNDAIAINGASFNNNSFLFDGVNDKIYHNPISFSKTQSWSFSQWQYKPTGSGTQWQAFIGYSVSQGGYWMWHPYLMWYQDYYDNGLGYEYYGYLGSSVSLGTQVPFDRWFNLTVVYDGPKQEASVYINGVLLEAKIITWSPRPVNEFKFNYIGSNNDRYFQGRIADTKIYNRILSQNEILQNYNSVKTRFNL